MTNNDILRRIRYIFDLSDTKMIAIFAAADHQITRAEVSDLLKRSDDPVHQECSDSLLATFLNGLINDRRGKKDGPQPEPEKELTNNIIFRKMKIALTLDADETLEILALADKQTRNERILPSSRSQAFPGVQRPSPPQLFQRPSDQASWRTRMSNAWRFTRTRHKAKLTLADRASTGTRTPWTKRGPHAELLSPDAIAASEVSSRSVHPALR